jgi:ElaB/YqjD/DUF883 family membrane-anchored ribosome-binding protein
MTVTAESREKLATDLKRLVRDSQELLRDSAGAAGEKARALGERFAEKLEGAKTAYRRLEGKAKVGAKATDKVIREHPYQSIGVAFGLGLLIGLLVVRR